MKLRTGLIISLFVCLLVIGSVSAADNGTDDKVTLEDNSISEASTADTISEPKQEVKEVTTDEVNDVSDKEVENANVKSTKKEAKNSKLESSGDDVVSDDNLFEVTFSSNPCYTGYDTLFTVKSHTSESGTLNIYVNDETKARTNYTLNQGLFHVLYTYNYGSSYGGSYYVNSSYVDVKIKDLGLKDGTYNIQIKFTKNQNEKLIAKKEITYKYEPFTVSYDTYREYSNGEEYGWWHNAISLYRKSSSENGILSIYINDETNPIKAYTINEDHSSGYSSYMTIYLKDLGIHSGTYNLTLKYKPAGDNEEIILKKGVAEYKYAPFYISSSTNDPISLSSNTDESGVLNIYVNGEKTPKKTYTINWGKFIIDGISESSQTLTMEDLELTRYNNNLTLTFKATDNEELFNRTYNVFNFPSDIASIEVYENLCKNDDVISIYKYYDYHSDYSNYYDGTLKIYADGVIKKTYNIKQNKFENISLTYYEESSSLQIYITANDLGINKEGNHDIKITFQESNKNEKTVIEKTVIHMPIDLNYSSEVNINKTTTISIKAPNDINGKIVAYTCINKYNMDEFGGYYRSYAKNEELGSWNVINGNVEFELTGTQIAKSEYDYLNHRYKYGIILEFTSNKYNFNKIIWFDVNYKYNHENEYETEHDENENNNNQNTENNGNNLNPINNGNNEQGPATSQGPNTDISTNTQSNTEKPSFTQTKTVKSVSKKAKQLTISTTLKLGTKKATKGKTVTFKIGSKTFKVKTNNKGVAKLTIKKADLKKILKKVKVGKKVKVQIKYGKTTVTKYIKVKK